MQTASKIRYVAIAGFIGLLMSGIAHAYEPPSTVIQQELTGIRYSSTPEFSLADPDNDWQDDTSADIDDGTEEAPGKKSPTKAFLLSMAVPGLGQLYYGSKWKAALFFGAEVATWAVYFNWHSTAVDMEDDFEAFNRAHWSRDDYRTYLELAYNQSDDNLVDAVEVTHHLPDTRTQQYYEMTGKYDQFSWGWDDAVLRDSTLDDFIVLDTIYPVKGANIPYSANRLAYEQMRADANNKFDDARKLIIVSLVNRLVSGFEAYFVTRSRSTTAGRFSSVEPRIKVRAALKSIHAMHDTPYMNVTFRF